MRWCDHLCDLVGFAVPAGLDAHGRPVGVTLLGPAWSEGRLAGIADALHRNVTHATPPPPAGHDMLIASMDRHPMKPPCSVSAPTCPACP
jgi:hypothetical protein